MRRYRCERVLLPEGLREDVTVSVSGEGTVLEVGGEPGDREVTGLVMPGLVNAHTHLELSHLRGRVPAGLGLPVWVDVLMALRDTVPGAAPAASRAVMELASSGTAGVVEVSNTVGAVGALAASGLQAVIQAEVIGIDGARAEAALERARAIDGHGLQVRPAPHAPYSTSAELVRRACAEPGPPATMHLDEDPAERQFLATGDGPWAAFLDRIGRDWSANVAPGCSPVAWLDSLGVLGPRLALVHLVGASGEDLDRVAASGASVVLCPRSNLHITGRLPDVPGMLARGVPLALGTDSLASCPDLDLFGEIATLARAFPDVPLEVWLHAATVGGSRVMDRPDLGEIRVGATPGLLRVGANGDLLDAIATGGRLKRRWLSCPGSAALRGAA